MVEGTGLENQQSRKAFRSSNLLLSAIFCVIMIIIVVYNGGKSEKMF